MGSLAPLVGWLTRNKMAKSSTFSAGGAECRWTIYRLQLKHDVELTRYDSFHCTDGAR